MGWGQVKDMSRRIKKSGGQAQSTRAMTRPVGWMLGVGFLAAALSQANVQVVNRRTVMTNALEKGRYEIEDDLMARRGSIFSSDGMIMAQNQDVYRFQLFYDRLPKSPGFFAELSLATGISVDDLRRPAMLGEKKRAWKSPIVGSEAKAVRSLMRRWNADGVSLEKVLVRSYPLGWTASGIVGLVRADKAINGLEKSLDSEMGGQDGEVRGFIDRTGAFLAVEDHDLQKLVQGKDVTLTIDSILQNEASLAVRHAVESNNAESGAAVAIDPKTGDILAMANYPTFDPEGTIHDNEDMNVAYRALFEPGSTFKVMTLAKTLDMGGYGQRDRMQCGGSITVPGKTIRCSHGAHGDIDWEKAIAESCNVAASRWAQKIGTAEMRQFVTDLGLLEKPNLGLPWEMAGRHNENDPAKAMQLANNGFGQAMNATPIALASAYSSLANGGVRMEPRLLAKVGDRETPVKEAGRIFSIETSEYVRELMIATIEKDFGTGKGLRISGYQLAGKTGTAQKLQGGRMVGYVSNFVGMVPAHDPKAVILVMINDPKGGSYYGGSVAGPVFARLAKTVIRRYGIAPDSERIPRGPKLPVEISAGDGR
jgi:cell division protein FtsI (penicillin-binding protein 3)